MHVCMYVYAGSDADDSPGKASMSFYSCVCMFCLMYACMYVCMYVCMCIFGRFRCVFNHVYVREAMRVSDNKGVFEESMLF